MSDDLDEFEKEIVKLLEKYNRFGAVIVLFDAKDNSQKVAANMCVACANDFLSQLIEDEGLSHENQHENPRNITRIH
jgi:hypothetical protein